MFSKSIFMILFVLGMNSAFAESPKAKYEIRWAFAHEPVEYFTKSANEFKKYVEKETNGEVTVKVISLKEADAEKFEDNRKRFLNGILKDQFDMTQVYTSNIADTYAVPSYHVFDLPYLFNDHDHVTKVVEGNIGKKLMAKLDGKPVVNLAFTYSGGFRSVPSKTRKISSYKDFKGMPYKSSHGSITLDVNKALGVKNIEKNLKENSLAENMAQGFVDGGDVTVADMEDLFDPKHPYTAKYLNFTQHSLVTTALLINEKFDTSMPVRLQKIVKDCAVRAARFEREYIINDEKRVMNKIKGMGFKVITMSEREKQKMRDYLSPIYKKYTPIVGSRLVKDIKKLGKKDGPSISMND